MTEPVALVFRKHKHKHRSVAPRHVVCRTAFLSARGVVVVVVSARLGGRGKVAGEQGSLVYVVVVVPVASSRKWEMVAWGGSEA